MPKPPAPMTRRLPLPPRAGRLFRAILFAAVASSARADDLWTKVELPAGAVNPRGAADAKGRIHVAYGVPGKGDDAFYVRWEEGKLTQPVQLNKGSAIALGGERGPQIAVAADGTLGVVWQNRDGLTCLLSRDDGAAWEPQEARDPGSAGGIDCPTIGADAKGGLIAVWVDGRDEKSKEPAAADIYSSRLGPGAKKFDKNVKINSPMKVCSCCFPHVAADDGGKFYVVFRGEDKNVRDACLFVTEDQGKTWRGGPVSQDHWKQTACCMSGPAIAVSADGKSVVAAWRTKDALRGTVSRDGAKKFAPAFDLAADVGMKDYPFAAIAKDGAAILLWTQDRKWNGAQIPAQAAAPKPFDPGLGGGNAYLLRGKDGRLVLLVGG